MTSKICRQAAHRVLVVDDEPSGRHALSEILRSGGYDVVSAHDGIEAVAKYQRQPADLVLTDLNMPHMDGLGLLEALREHRWRTPVIVVTAASDARSAVAAMRAGAHDYLTKPLDAEGVLLAAESALRDERTNVNAEAPRGGPGSLRVPNTGGLLGASPVMQEVFDLVRKVAPSNATVLITGESGTGKGELARVIHRSSPRAAAPLVSVHCAALAESVLESELFGHERGSFTGAERRRIGRFEQANGGTLFLDEIGEISPSVQVKLLNVLQDRSLERVGGNAAIPLDVRVIAATNRNLLADVERGRFREDLYYRLNVVHLRMPPLRQRADDVLILARSFLSRFAQENAKSISGFSPEACERLSRGRWPGNVRELENAIERAVVLCEGPRIEAHCLPADSAAPPAPSGEPSPPSSTELVVTTMADLERTAILQTLDAVGGSTTQAAALLDMSVRTIQNRLREYGLARSRGRRPSTPPNRKGPHH